MISLSRQALIQATDGTALRGALGPAFNGLFTDTRSPVPGGLFFALSGPNFDAHDFLSTAVKEGAGGLVVSNPAAVPSGLSTEVLVLKVRDVGLALLEVAKAARKAMSATVIAVTGSVGKTTMKNMLGAALSPFGKVGLTPGNYNNAVGLPLTLAGMDGDEAYVVLELGMNAPGEIADLTRVADPDIGLITGAEAAHLAFFPSIDAIADAKAELFQAMRPGTQSVANGDDARIMARAGQRTDMRLLTYGEQVDLTCHVTDVSSDTSGLRVSLACEDWQGTLTLAALGDHHAHHAAGALAVTRALGLDLDIACEGMSQGFRAAKHRLNLVKRADGLMILDDSYNANPASMRAALRTFEGLARKASQRVAVLGSMLELGHEAPAYHRACGRLAAEVGCDRVFAVGPHAGDIVAGAAAGGVPFVHAADDVTELMPLVARHALSGTWILLKGSRGGRLERVLEFLGGGGEG